MSCCVWVVPWGNFRTMQPGEPELHRRAIELGRALLGPVSISYARALSKSSATCFSQPSLAAVATRSNRSSKENADE